MYYIDLPVFNLKNVLSKNIYCIVKQLIYKKHRICDVITKTLPLLTAANLKTDADFVLTEFPLSRPK